MKKNKILIKLFLNLIISTMFCCCANAMETKNEYRPNENIFINKNNNLVSETENFEIVLNKNSNKKFSGQTAQIAFEAFFESLLENFKSYSDFNIKNNLKNIDILPTKQDTMNNLFVLNLCFDKKDKKNKKIVEKLQTYFKNKFQNKKMINKIIDRAKNKIDNNFEKYRKNINEELIKMKKYYEKRHKKFNDAVYTHKKQFREDFSKFTKFTTEFFMLFNPEKIDNINKLKKDVEQMKKDCRNLNFKSKIFRIYKEKVVGPNLDKLENFVGKCKKQLNQVSKREVKKCLQEIANSNIKLKKF